MRNVIVVERVYLLSFRITYEMSEIRRFVIYFTIFFIGMIGFVLIYYNMFGQSEFEILTPVGVVVALLLILLCNLMPSRRKGEFDHADLQQITSSL